MKATTLIVSLCLLIGLVNACKKEETQPVSIANVLVDGDFESSPYQDWRTDVNRNSKTKPNSYTVDYSTEAASSPTHSIKVSCNAAYNDSTYQLLQQVFYLAGTAPTTATKVLTVPAGARLTMRAKIKTVNIQGNGISIAIGGNYGASKNYASAFYTSTEGKVSITGTGEFKEYSITFDSFPGDAYSVYALIFFLPNTTGTAYYDDVSLSVN